MKTEYRWRIYNKYKGHCAYCGREIKYSEMQVDHLYPKRSIRLESMDNHMPSCRRCNHYKRGHKLEVFRDMINTIHERIMNTYIAKVAADYGILQFNQWDGKFYFERIHP